MKILFWLEPAEDYHKPNKHAWWGDQLLLLDSLLRLNKPDYESVVVSFEAYDSDAIKNYKGTWIKLGYQDIYSLQSAPGAIDQAMRSEEGGLDLANKLCEKIGGFRPDVVFWFYDFPALRQSFSDALFINIEFSWFARDFFPEYYQLDPFGHGKARLIAENIGLFTERALTRAEQALLDAFRRKTCKVVESKDADVYFAALREEFSDKRLVLLPLGERYILDGRTPIAVGLDKILSQAPLEEIYIITVHPLESCLNEFELRWLEEKHSNARICRDRNIHTVALLPKADAVVGDFGSVSLYGLIFNIPIISVSDKLPAVDQFFINRNPLLPHLLKINKRQRDCLLLNLLLHSTIPPERLFDDSWLSNYLDHVLAYKHSGNLARLFDQPLVTLDEWLKDSWLELDDNANSSIEESDDIEDKKHFFEDGGELQAAAKTNPKSTLRAIAFYLPQFHCIAENDAWWGEGFTEWVNVRQGRPLFEGHDQPRIPTELGYYDLSNVQTLARQAELAREYGLEGFCFYHYWFDGKRLLEKPVDQLLQNPEIDLPFCLCWANENWTRRWDGADQEVLIEQSYSADLNERFALDLLPYMKDPRYIRVGGKPVFLVYRSDIIPELEEVVGAWREAWRAHGLGEVYLICVESFQVIDPKSYGFDAACEFLPHQLDFSRFQLLFPFKNDFDASSRIIDYQAVSGSWTERLRAPYKRFRGIIPAWDNSSRRRKGGATVLHGSSPQIYEQWLRRTAACTLDEFSGDERLIFINAWNEWGEGCYLEPDGRHGRAYLEATQRILETEPQILLSELESDRPLTIIDNWIKMRAVSSIQRSIIDKYLASQEACLVGAVLLDLENEPEKLALTLESLRSDAGIFAFMPLIVSTALCAPEGYEDFFVSLKHGSMLAILNSVLDTAGFEWFICVRAGEQFTPSGLHMVRVELAKGVTCTAIYADEIILDEAGRGVLLRPDFNLDLLLSLPSAMASHWLFRFDVFKDFGGFDVSFQDAFEFEYIVRLIETVGMDSIGHLDEPLVITNPIKFKNNADEIRVLDRHLSRRNYNDGLVLADLPGRYRLLYGHAEKPLVSIIIPTKDQLPMLLRCVTSLLETTRYPNFEVLIVDNNSKTVEARNWLDGVAKMGGDKVRVLRYPQPFNYSAINNMAAREARGEYLVLLNNDTGILHEDWLEALMNHGQRPEVGVVGAKLLYPNGKIQHAGVILGLRGPADHPFVGREANDPGYMYRMQVDQNLTAVTAACLLIRKSVYDQVGGLDEEAFKVSYNDIDLCLKVREAGYLTVWCPYSVVMHVGSASQNRIDVMKSEAKRERFMAEQDAMYKKWLPIIARDPAYNSNLSLIGNGFEVEADAGLTWRPLSWRPLPVVLAYMADRAGCGQYRIIQPFNTAKEAGLIDGTLSSRLLSIPELERYSPDSIVFQRQLSDKQLQTLNRTKKFSHAFKIYELDDYIPNLPVKSVHRASMPKDVVKSLRRALTNVDRFVVSTEPLAEAFSGMHGDIRIVKNSLDPRWWTELISVRRISSKPRVGWAGGVSHAGDLEMIADVVKALANEVEWVFFGMCPDKLRPYIHEFYPGVAIERYPKALASLNLDLALAPVEQNLFNECKSNLRLLEYGACGFPVICSDVRCYQGDGLPVTRVKNRFRDWVDAIRAHINDLDAAARAGDELRAAVLSGWMLKDENLEAWRKAWLPD